MREAGWRSARAAGAAAGAAAVATGPATTACAAARRLRGVMTIAPSVDLTSSAGLVMATSGGSASSLAATLAGAGAAAPAASGPRSNTRWRAVSLEKIW